jgi:hypothetical protein
MPTPGFADDDISDTLAVMTAVAVAAVVIAAMAVPTLRSLRETLPPETRVEINTPATGS